MTSFELVGSLLIREIGHLALPLLCSLMVIMLLFFELCDFIYAISNRRETLPLLCEEHFTMSNFL
jgi:hypothetical protein